MKLRTLSFAFWSLPTRILTVSKDPSGFCLTVLTMKTLHTPFDLSLEQTVLTWFALAKAFCRNWMWKSLSLEELLSFQVSGETPHSSMKGESVFSTSPGATNLGDFFNNFPIVGPIELVSFCILTRDRIMTVCQDKSRGKPLLLSLH